MTTHETCGRCDGSGEIACSSCRGIGTVKEPGIFTEERKVCASCKGTGRDRCHSCGGTGTVKIDD